LNALKICRGVLANTANLPEDAPAQTDSSQNMTEGDHSQSTKKDVIISFSTIPGKEIPKKYKPIKWEYDGSPYASSSYAKSPQLICHSQFAI